MMIKRICAVCKKEFEISSHQIKFGRGKFCSTVCQYEAKRKHFKTDCRNCGKEILDGPSKRRVYCGRKCRADYLSKNFTRERAWNWKGGRIKNEQGYIMVVVTNHPSSYLKCSTEYLLEHRLVVEKAMGRYLNNDEHVHHLNGIKDDNRLENLQVMSNSEHKKLHTSQRSIGGMFIKGEAIFV